MGFFHRKKSSAPAAPPKDYSHLQLNIFHLSAILLAGACLGLEIWAFVRSHSDHTLITLDATDIKPENVFSTTLDRYRYTPNRNLTIHDTSLGELYHITKNGYDVQYYTCIDDWCMYTFLNTSRVLKNAYDDFPRQLLLREASPLLNGSMVVKFKEHIAARLDPEILKNFIQEIISTEKIMRIASIACTGTIFLATVLNYFTTLIIGRLSVPSFVICFILGFLQDVKAITVMSWQYSTITPSQQQISDFFSAHYEEWGLKAVAHRYDLHSTYINIAIFILSLLILAFNFIVGGATRELLCEPSDQNIDQEKEAASKHIVTV